MGVIRNTFSGELSADPSSSYTTYTITGLTSETSTTNFSRFNEEASLHFLNALYQTLLDAGYSDALMDENDFSITVLGFKFFVLICGSSYLIPYMYAYGTSNSPYFGSNGYINGYSSNQYTSLEYNITVRGDSNHVSLYLGNYNSPTIENYLFSIAKGKNLMTNSDIYLFSQGINYCYTSGSGYMKYHIREKSDLYNSIWDSSANPLVANYTYKGLNTNLKFICNPMLANYGTILIYSMIQGNTSVFTSGKYYKIGNEIYYNDNNYLFKVG